MIVQILSVGENKNSYLKVGEKDYIKRLKHYCRLEMDTIKEEKIRKNQGISVIQKLEATRLIGQLPRQAKVVALDQKGKCVSSIAFTQKIQQWHNESVQRVVFIVGGPLGLHETLLQRADWILSLSKMTFTHEMARMLLLEQIYRAYTIIRGEKYHK